MPSPAIEVSGLSKRYVIQHESRHDSLRDTLHHTARKLWRRFRWGTGFETEEFWALRDVSFAVQPGEVVGIIGRNGAGKSTLLKVLSRITEPTAGSVRLRGRIASLLEVGTGFHPDLSGRENIFLNGAILGMSRAEITRKFDEIVAFAEIERFLDTPVKRYSSGMYVRLAFAVAAHLEPEILIIDEVLAVGDAQFQKKCLGKMQEVAQGGGRTVLFVSHNMGVIANLCSRVIMLGEGRVLTDGTTSAGVNAYIQAAAHHAGEATWREDDPVAGNERMRLHAARVTVAGRTAAEVPIDQDAVVEFDFAVTGARRRVSTSIHLFDKQGVWVLCSGPASAELDPGAYRHRVTLPGNLLNDGLYQVSIILLTDVTNIQVQVRDAVSFTVHETGVGREEYGGVINGCVRPQLRWQSVPLPPTPSSA
ncbi:ATP-binding cassette domain-containing protein [Oleiharenicola lentus]|uniref:ATP-binding cassette domain-containing protein n=1 Tax=Oleiharenicola lentus TaxID=2508720 RepID=A0A4Q1CBP3_9BACT|nr:polysaccharide ABC transporter ATP-binding protein [Oleiharenicola lentus]RXK56514.1 ATP-binding cassette domain-containing protein [Oleiharenicola lentus]